jgi:hypothetical protein
MACYAEQFFERTSDRATPSRVQYATQRTVFGAAAAKAPLGTRVLGSENTLHRSGPSAELTDVGDSIVRILTGGKPPLPSKWTL